MPYRLCVDFFTGLLCDMRNDVLRERGINQHRPGKPSIRGVLKKQKPEESPGLSRPHKKYRIYHQQFAVFPKTAE